MSWWEQEWYTGRRRGGDDLNMAREVDGALGSRKAAGVGVRVTPW